MHQPAAIPHRLLEVSRCQDEVLHVVRQLRVVADGGRALRGVLRGGRHVRHGQRHGQRHELPAVVPERGL
eukprot:scaffold97899_cov69-Phaeocystis_antarctica.AAC.2